MVKSIGKYQVPYDAEGNLLHYSGQSYNYTTRSYQDTSVWLDNEPFQAEMELVTFGRGRSAATFHWKKVDDGRKFPMFMTDMVDLIKFGSVINGRTPLQKWVVVKRGQNYGLAFYEE